MPGQETDGNSDSNGAMVGGYLDDEAVDQIFAHFAECYADLNQVRAGAR